VSGATNPAVQVREMHEGDLDVVAALHVAAFPNSVLGRLGVDAVARNYRWQLNGPHDLTALVARADDRIVGFLLGGIFRGSTIGFVKAERWFLARRVLRHPELLLRGVGWKRVTLGLRLLARRSTPAASEVPAAVPVRSFGVLAIAVDPDAQSRGVGGALMAEATRRAQSSAFVSMHLTVHPSNTSAVAFYRSLGWTPVDDADGSWSGQMTLRLDPRP